MLLVIYSLTADQWSAIGQWVGAAGTLWAVVVSLKLSREAKIAAYPQLKIVSVPGSFADDRDTRIFKVVNVGQVPITIVSFYCRSPKSRRGKETALFMDKDFVQHGPPQNLPFRLAPLEAVEISCSETIVKAMLRIHQFPVTQEVELVLVDGLNNIYTHGFSI